MTCKKQLLGDQYLRYISRQTACGIIDNNPVFKLFQDATISGKPELVINHEKSARVSPTRNPGKQIKVSETMEASFEFEMTLDTVNLLEASLYSTFSPYFEYSAVGTIEYSASTNKILDSADGFTGISTGDWIFVDIDGFGTEEAFHVLNKVSDGELDIHPFQLNVDQSAANGVFKSSNIVNGTDYHYHTIQKRLRDLSAPEDSTAYITQYDALFSTLDLSFVPGAKFTGTVGTTSLNRNPGKSKIFGQSDAAETNYDTVASCNGLADTFWFNDNKANAGITEVSFSLNNTMQTIDQAGSCAPGAAAVATIELSGSINTIAFEDSPLAQIDKYEDGTRFSLSIPVKFPTGEQMIIHFPQVLYTEASQPDSADESILTSGTFTAETGPNGYAIQFSTSFDTATI